MSEWRPAPSNFLVRLLGLVLVLASPGKAASLSAQLTTTEINQLQREARLVVNLVQNYHYSGATFLEIKNQEILDRFLSELDPDNDILGADDVEFIHQRFDRGLKSVYLFRGDLQPAFEIFDLYAEMARARMDWVDERLTRPFDFTADEFFVERRPGDPPNKATQTADQRWELRLKDQMLHEILSGRTEEEARTRLRQIFAESGRAIGTFDSFAVREEFLDAALRSFDPHSGYSSADSTREFAVGMKGAVTGLGIVVGKAHGLCVVTGVHPGSPADLHSPLARGDVILALADGDSPWIDVSSQRLRETVGMMRGAVNGKLRVAYRPAGTTERREITLERTKVVLCADRARGAISQLPAAGGKTKSIGWIALPTFYASAEGEDTVSAASDVRELLEQMKAAPIDGLVLDLRRNPGGALTEAVAISQLFLPRGTVMLSRGVDGKLKTLAVEAKPPVYTGPLVVLTSSYSASASEIFAGAMKYHRRALIVGSAATFGKGTSQNYIDLAKAQGLTGDSVKDWGMLRLTSERFYLPDGSAVQRQGIASDIVLPAYDAVGLKREADLPHALIPETVAPPADPVRGAPELSEALLQSLQAAATQDFVTLPEWQLWKVERAVYEDEFERRSHPLNKETRSREWEAKLVSYQGARATRRECMTASAFASRPVEIAAVRATLDDHQRKLAALPSLDGQPPLHRLQRDFFLVETEQGRLQDLKVQDIDFLSLCGDAATLAEAYSHASGRPITPAAMRTALQDWALLEHRNDQAMLMSAAKISGEGTEPADARRGVEAVLLRITELEPELPQELPGLDIPLRESQRLAARWAEQAASSTP